MINPKKGLVTSFKSRSMLKKTPISNREITKEQLLNSLWYKKKKKKADALSYSVFWEYHQIHCFSLKGSGLLKSTC